jgi:hypothetical protein
LILKIKFNLKIKFKLKINVNLKITHMNGCLSITRITYNKLPRCPKRWTFGTKRPFEYMYVLGFLVELYKLAQEGEGKEGHYHGGGRELNGNDDRAEGREGYRPWAWIKRGAGYYGEEDKWRNGDDMRNRPCAWRRKIKGRGAFIRKVVLKNKQNITTNHHHQSSPRPFLNGRVHH